MVPRRPDPRQPGAVARRPYPKDRSTHAGTDLRREPKLLGSRMRILRLSLFLVLGAFAVAACESPDWTVGKRELGHGFKVPH